MVMMKGGIKSGDKLEVTAACSRTSQRDVSQGGISGCREESLSVSKYSHLVWRQTGA